MSNKNNTTIVAKNKTVTLSNTLGFFDAEQVIDALRTITRETHNMKFKRSYKIDLVMLCQFLEDDLRSMDENNL